MIKYFQFLNKCVKKYFITKHHLLIGGFILFASTAHGEIQIKKQTSLQQTICSTEEIITSHPDSALAIFNKILSNTILNKDYTDSLLSQLYFNHAQCYKELNLTDSAQLYYQLALNAISNDNNLKYKSEILHNVGNFYLGLGDIKLALHKYKQAYLIRKKLGLKKARAKTISNMGVAYFRLRSIDSALICHNEALLIKQSLADSAGISLTLTNIGNIYLFQTDFTKAVEYYSLAKSFIDTTIPSLKLASIINNIGNIYNRQGQYTNALDHYLKALEIFETLNHKPGTAKMFNNISLIYFELHDLDKAMIYNSKALNYFNELNDKIGIADSHFYLGRIYHSLKNYTKAKSLYLNALWYETTIGDKSGIADCLHNLGVLYLDISKVDSAIFYFNKASEAYTETSNMYGLTTTLNNLSKSYFKLNQFNKSKKYAEKAMIYAHEYNGLTDIIDSYTNLALSLEGLKRFKDATAIYKQITYLSDSLYRLEKNETILKLESKYHTIRKQKELDQQKNILKERYNKIEYRENEIRSQKRLRYFHLAFFSILGGFLIYILKNLNQKKNTNKKLIIQQENIVKKNIELSYLNTELKSQQSQIEEQNEILINQNAKIEKANKNWEESVEYAQYIQKAVLPSNQALNEILKNYFIFYEPKNTVSGDFYWASKFESKTFIAVGDCSANGVPGGFLSMLGISFLKEIISIEKSHDTTHIINKLRDLLIDSLRYKNTILEYNDSIDLSIVIIDHDLKTLQFSGANQRAFLIQNNNCIELLGDKMSVGQLPKIESFSSQTINFSDGDTMYMLTDGLYNQCNSSSSKQSRKNFNTMLKEISSKPMNIQKEIIYNNFIDWKEGNEQIDDTTVLAFKIEMS